MVDLGAGISSDAVSGQGLPYRPGEVRQRLDVLVRERHAVVLNQIEPVAAPRDIAANLAEARNIHHYAGAAAVTCDIFNRDAARRVQRGADYAYGSLDAVRAGRDSAEMREAHNHANGAVPAH